MKDKKVCSVINCNKIHYGKSFCKSHYAKHYKEKNEKKVTEQRKKYYQKNKIKIKKYRKEYVQKNMREI